MTRVARIVGGCLALALGAACGSPTGFAHPPASTAPAEVSADLPESAPEEQGVDSEALCALTDAVSQGDTAIFSILVSRHGTLVYELYTSNITRQDAHYVMSVTKTFTSALVGIAIDQHVLSGADAKVSDLLPSSLFPSDAAREGFSRVTLKDVLGMSALDAPVPPHLVNDETRARARAFREAPNRARFALSQAVLPEPGRSFQYTDVTPQLATGALAYAAKITAFDFALANLFEPLHFRNVEWMHEDIAGIDNGAYGLRMRPTDMHKFGLLYLRGGFWEGRRVVSEAWVKESFTPWIRSRPTHVEPNYGWYWWAPRFGGHPAHVANGWKGQRIIVVPDQDLVVTITGAMESGEDAAVATVMEFVERAVKDAPLAPRPDLVAALRAKLRRASLLPRVRADIEPRMVPSVAPKERHHRFTPSSAP